MQCNACKLYQEQQDGLGRIPHARNDHRYDPDFPYMISENDFHPGPSMEDLFPKEPFPEPPFRVGFIREAFLPNEDSSLTRQESSLRRTDSLARVRQERIRAVQAYERVDHFDQQTSRDDRELRAIGEWPANLN